MLEREILELPPDPRHSEAVCERGVKVSRFLSNAAALFGRQIIERAHVVQAIGELDQDYTRILRDREQELAVILDLPFLRRIQWQVTDLRQAIHDLGDFLPELRFYLGNGDVRVFDDIVDQTACDSYGIELKVCENSGDFDA